MFINRCLILREFLTGIKTRGFSSLYRNVGTRRFVLLFIFIILLSPTMTFAVPPNTIIDNMAEATYTLGIIKDIESESNIVRVITVLRRTPSTIDLLRYAPENSYSELVPVSTTYYGHSRTRNGQLNSIPPPIPIGENNPINLDFPVPLIQSNRHSVGTPVFIRLTDYDQNIDSSSIETILVNLLIEDNNDSELLRLSETNRNSGIFTGYIQTSNQYPNESNNGQLAVEESYELQVDYTDIYDSNDSSSDSTQFILSDRSIYIIKSAGKKVVSAGDYLQYNLRVENVSIMIFDEIDVIDRLPYPVRYKEGSATIGGNNISDPLISDDGHILTFDAGGLYPDEAIDLRYIVEVGVNANPGKITNEAYATDNIATLSNIARTTVRVKDDLYRNDCFIVGRVISGKCKPILGVDPVSGVAGARIYLENGTYAVTDINGMYHFEGVEPGVHVLQLDFEGLSDKYDLTSCEENSRTAGSLTSRFIDLQGGTTWQADFRVMLKPKQTGDIQMRLTSSLQDTIVHNELSLQVNEVPIRNPRLMIMLPRQMNYIPGSSNYAGMKLDDPLISGNIITYRVEDIPGNWGKNLNFKTSLKTLDESGLLGMTCMLIYDTPEQANQKTKKIRNKIYLAPDKKRIQLPQIILHPKFDTFSASLDSTELIFLDKAVENLHEANITEIIVTGHSDNVPINPRSRFICGDNYELSLTRAKSVAQYLATALRLDISKITVEGRGPDEPIADNSSYAGKALNRRVELTIFAEEILDRGIPEFKQKTDSTFVKTIGLRPGEIWERPDADKKITQTINSFNQGWLDTAQPGLEWLWPPVDYNPPIPSLKVAVKHHADSIPKLFLDGDEVSPLNFSEIIISESGNMAISFWSGIDIHQGFNKFTAVISNSDGTEINRVESSIHYAGPPVYIEFIDSLSNLIADNRVNPVIAVRLTDKDGYPARPGVIGQWSVEPPYAAQQQLENLQNNPLLSLKGKKPNYVIGENGIALLKLQASSTTGEAIFRFYFVDDEEELRVWLKPKLRDWVVVGLAEGTIGYNSTKGNSEYISDSGINSKFHEDGRTSFFASGSVKNNWLLTIASDTKKIGNGSNQDLMQSINPETYYPMYGDAVQQGYAASSTQGVFVKIEQDRYFALYGDFNTGLNVSELSRYNRTFTGFKSELQTEKNNFNIYASETNLAFVKDELRGDGTSGLYYLTRNNIAMNSEKITIEIRDRFRNEDIVSTEVMRRYLDYNIDYYEGTIYFKQPIPSRDELLNPVFIVAIYESNDNSDRSFNFGGRSGMKVLENKLELGGTYIHEGRVGGHGDLGGFDATYKISKSTELKTEFAVSGLKIGAGKSSGFAYLTELKHNVGKFNGKIYIRNHEPDFGLGQQNNGQIGTRKIGADLVRRINEKFQIGTQFYRQYNLLSDSKRNFVEAKLNYANKRFTGRTGFRFAEDQLGNGMTNRSNQLNAGVEYKFFNNKFNVRLDREQSIGENENADFPTRTTLGADYNLSQYITFYIQEEFARGEFEDSEDTRVGIKARPWAGAQVNSSVQRHSTENGERVFSNIGLIQAWRVNDKFSMDIGLDHGRIVQDPENIRLNPNEPPTSGSLDGFTAISLGGSYREDSWSSSSRIEFRNAQSEDKYGIVANIFGEPRPGIGLLLSTKIYNAKAVNGLNKNSGDIQFSLVHRPLEAKWIVLNKLNFIYEEQYGGEFNIDNWRLVDNLSLNHRYNKKTRISFQYGAKYLREDIDSYQFSDYVDLIGLESRYDITPKWDIGLRVSLLHSWNLKQYDYSNGISVGYNLLKNAWVSTGYNFAGFTDKDFSAGSYSAKGPYLTFRIKVDYESAKSVIQLFRSTNGDGL